MEKHPFARRNDPVVDRRLFIVGVAGTLLAAPFCVRAQPRGKIWRIGFLGANTPAAAGHLTVAFLNRLRELGWTESRDFVVEYRWAAGRTEKFHELAAELVAANVDVIVTSGNAPVVAAHQVTNSIPIVMASSGDIVRSGIVKSLARPGGNVTGLTFVPEDTVGKRLELIKLAVPQLHDVAVLFNPAANQFEVDACQAVAPVLGLRAHVFEFNELSDLERIATAPSRSAIGAMFVSSDPLVFTNRVQISDFAIRQKLPTVHRLKEYAIDGGLISYGPNFPDFFRRAAEYVDKILKGARPADLPVEQPTKFELVINLKTAKALGLTIPQQLLLRADEVIK